MDIDDLTDTVEGCDCVCDCDCVCVSADISADLYSQLEVIVFVCV
jgi:hypothetical protein